MDHVKRKLFCSYLLYYGYAVLVMIILAVLWPLNRIRAGYFFILAGSACFGVRLLLPEGLTSGNWNTDKRRREMLWSGVVGIILGVLTLLIS